MWRYSNYDVQHELTFASLVIQFQCTRVWYSMFHYWASTGIRGSAASAGTVLGPGAANRKSVDAGFREAAVSTLFKSSRGTGARGGRVRCCLWRRLQKTMPTTATTRTNNQPRCDRRTTEAEFCGKSEESERNCPRGICWRSTAPSALILARKESYLSWSWKMSTKEKFKDRPGFRFVKGRCKLRRNVDGRVQLVPCRVHGDSSVSWYTPAGSRVVRSIRPVQRRASSVPLVISVYWFCPLGCTTSRGMRLASSMTQAGS